MNKSSARNPVHGGLLLACPVSGFLCLATAQKIIIGRRSKYALQEDEKDGCKNGTFRRSTNSRLSQTHSGNLTLAHQQRQRRHRFTNHLPATEDILQKIIASWGSIIKRINNIYSFSDKPGPISNTKCTIGLVNPIR